VPADQDLFDEVEIPAVEETSDDDADELIKIIQPFDPAEIRVETKQLSLDTLLSRIEHDEIVLQPEFQRQEVWKDDARSRLIESILIRIPLPAFYVDATDEDKWLVVALLSVQIRSTGDMSPHLRLEPLRLRKRHPGTIEEVRRRLRCQSLSTGPNRVL
jgi:hypothetical protein